VVGEDGLRVPPLYEMTANTKYLEAAISARMLLVQELQRRGRESSYRWRDAKARDGAEPPRLRPRVHTATVNDLVPALYSDQSIRAEDRASRYFVLPVISLQAEVRVTVLADHVGLKCSPSMELQPCNVVAPGSADA